MAIPFPDEQAALFLHQKLDVTPMMQATPSG